MLEIGREIEIKLVQFEDNVLVVQDAHNEEDMVMKKVNDDESEHTLDGRLRIFKEIYTLIHLFNDEINENIAAEGEEKMGENKLKAQKLK